MGVPENDIQFSKWLQYVAVGLLAFVSYQVWGLNTKLTTALSDIKALKTSDIELKAGEKETQKEINDLREQIYLKAESRFTEDDGSRLERVLRDLIDARYREHDFRVKRIEKELKL